MNKLEDSMQILYEEIFTMEFLVKYGYYDISIKNYKNDVSILDELDDLEEYEESNEFFSTIFNMNNVYDLIRDSDKLKDIFDKTDRKKKGIIGSEPIYFSIPKTEDSRRLYKMPNLYNYMFLADFICKNKEEFIDTFLKNKMSTSKFFGQLNFNFNTTNQIRERILYGGKNLLHLDLANFYHTLYTHSIPWVIDGKDTSKKEKNKQWKDKKFSDKLDRCIMSCQYDETHGIPTGNLISKIIAELYMCKIDKRFEDKGMVYSRYVDDITFPFNSETAKVDFLREFNITCRELNLIINERKTYTEQFPYEDKNNKEKIFTFLDKLDKKKSIWNYINTINCFINYCISEESKGNKGSIKCIFSVILNHFKIKKIGDKKINLIFSTRDNITEFNLLEKLIDISLKDSRLTNKFINFITNLNSLGLSKESIYNISNKYFDTNKVKLLNSISSYQQSFYNQEIYQLLIYIIIFDIDNFLDEKILLETFYFNNHYDDYNLALATMIYLKSNFNKDILIDNVEMLFSNIHTLYSEDASRMSEKLWLFRYFIYYLVEENIISKSEINKRCEINKIELEDKFGYKSELNWKYVKTDQLIDDFYNELLNNKVKLISWDNKSLQYFK